MKEIIAVIGQFLAMSITNPKKYFLSLFLLVLLSVAIISPLIIAGVILGIGIQAGFYVLTLWTESTSDTKLLVIVSCIGIMVSVPFLFSKTLKHLKLTLKSQTSD